MSLIGAHEHQFDISKVHGYNAKLSPLENLIANQKNTYEKIYEPQKPGYDTPAYHYDWWLFPVAMPKDQNWSDTSAYYSLNQERTAALLDHKEFKERYLASVNLYLQAQNKNWNGYEVRLGKVLLSLMHFMDATKDQEKLNDFHNQLKSLASTALEVVDRYHMHQDNFPYNAYHRTKHFLHEINEHSKSKRPPF